MKVQTLALCLLTLTALVATLECKSGLGTVTNGDLQKSRLIESSRTIVMCNPVKIEKVDNWVFTKLIVWKSLRGKTQVNDTVYYKWREWKEQVAIDKLFETYVLFIFTDVKDTVTDREVNAVLRTMYIDRSYLVDTRTTATTKAILDSIDKNVFVPVVVVSTDNEMLGLKKNATMPVKYVSGKSFVLDTCRCVTIKQLEDYLKSYLSARE